VEGGEPSVQSTKSGTQGGAHCEGAVAVISWRIPMQRSNSDRRRWGQREEGCMSTQFEPKNGGGWRGRKDRGMLRLLASKQRRKMGQLGPAQRRAMEEGAGDQPICARGSRGTSLLQTIEGPAVRRAQRHQWLAQGRSRGSGRGEKMVVWATVGGLIRKRGSGPTQEGNSIASYLFEFFQNLLE
jgi:hypothetical protein